MRVDEIILETVIKEISNKISPSLHCLLYWHSQTACPKIHKETDMSACVQACTFICDLTGVLWQLQRVRWLCWAQFLWELQVCVPSAPFPDLLVVSPLPSPELLPFHQPRQHHQHQVQLLCRKPTCGLSEQLKGLPRQVGITASQQHASAKSVTSVFAWGLCELCAFSHCRTAHSCCSEDDI